MSEPVEVEDTKDRDQRLLDSMVGSEMENVLCKVDDYRADKGWTDKYVAQLLSGWIDVQDGWLDYIEETDR